MRAPFSKKLTLAIGIMFLAIIVGTSAISAADIEDSGGEINDSAISPWASWHDSDSADILRNQMTAKYKSLNLAKAEEIVTYEGSTLWSRTNDLTVNGDILYVYNLNGLQVFDITNPNAPELLKSIYLGYGDEYTTIFLDGNYLYVPRFENIYIFDVSDPVNPSQVGLITLSGSIMKIHVENDRLYAGILRYHGEWDRQPALYIYDVSDPSNPSSVGKYEPPNTYMDARMFTVTENYIYAINHWEGNMEVISIADETRPERVGNYSFYYPRNITHYNNFLYVSDYNTLKVYDISTPESPTEVATYATSTIYGLETTAGGRLYFSYHDPYDNGYINIYDIQPDGTLDSIGTYSSRAVWYALEVVNNTLYLPEKWQGFAIVNVLYPESPYAIGFYSSMSSSLYDLAIKDDYVYLSNYMSYVGGPEYNGLYTVDISDRQNPFPTDYDETSGNPRSVCVTDTLVILSDCPPSRIYRLTDPSNPVYISEYAPKGGGTKGSLARDTILFVPTYPGPHIVNIANPLNPVQISAIDTLEARETHALMLMGNLLYIGCSDWDFHGHNRQFLRTVDISDLANPILLDELFLDSADVHGNEMCRRGSYIYLAAANKGLKIIDISNPAKPDIANQYIPAGGDFFRDVDTKRNYIFVNGRYSLQIFDVTDPLDPNLVQFVPLPDFPERMKIEGDYLYIANLTGLLIFKLNFPPAACGDANADGTVNISDAVYIINYIFAGGLAPDPMEAADVNCDETVNVSDAVWIINYIFVGGKAPCDIDGDGIGDC